MIDVPTFAEVLVMHELTLETFGGMRGVTEQGFGKLEAALATPHQSMFGDDLYPDLASKAAALFWGLIRAHALSDGNKRIALVALLDLLARNDAQLAVDDNALYAFVMWAADAGNRDEAIDWITAHLVAA